MPKLTINGKTVTCDAGTPLIEAAKQVGEHIPYFCYHPSLTRPASCRMCLVEVEKAPKLMPACYTTVAEGMVVLTKSDKVIRARKAVLEFLLLNHPVDCPICDQAGECTLQNLYLVLRAGEPPQDAQGQQGQGLSHRSRGRLRRRALCALHALRPLLRTDHQD